MDKNMPDDTMVEELAVSPGEEATARKPYAPPKLTELGSLAELTRGGDQEQRGEGPGFSL